MPKPRKRKGAVSVSTTVGICALIGISGLLVSTGSQDAAAGPAAAGPAAAGPAAASPGSRAAGWQGGRPPAHDRVASAPGSLVVEPQDGFGHVYSFISSARTSLEMTMYELSDLRAEEGLAADARRGVDVRVLLDQDYEGRSHNAAAFAWLTRHRVHVRWAPRDTIVHQKSIVVDGREALVATFNLEDVSNYYATTRDFGVFDTNRADVSSIVRVFDSDWAGRPIVAPPASEDGADLVWSPGSEPRLVSIVERARRSLLVENEEMDDEAIVSSLAAASRRGVDVEVVMTRDSYYAQELDQLVRSGVHVRTYSYYAPLYIHAKVIVADAGSAEQQMFLGSENFSVSSLDYNRELGLVVRSPAEVAVVARTVRADYEGAQPWRA